jgi:hypothetical protein
LYTNNEASELGDGSELMNKRCDALVPGTCGMLEPV